MIAVNASRTKGRTVGLFGKSDERTAVKNLIANLSSDIAAADASILANLEEADVLRSKSSAKRAPKWEYLVLNDIEESAINEQGIIGWEMVNAVSYTTGYGLGGNTSMNVHMRYIFKRPFDAEYPDGTRTFFENIEAWNERKRELQEQLSLAIAEHNAL